MSAEDVRACLLALYEATIARDIVYELPEDVRGPASVVEMVEDDYNRAVEDAEMLLLAVSPSLHTHAEQESAASCAPDGKAGA